MFLSIGLENAIDIVHVVLEEFLLVESLIEEVLVGGFKEVKRLF